MYTVQRDGQRTIIEASISSQAKTRNWLISGYAMKLIGHTTVGLAALTTLANAWKNPSAENLTLATVFTAVAVYAFKAGEDAKLTSPPTPIQRLTLDGDTISFDFNINDKSSPVVFNAQFVEVDIQDVEGSPIIGITLSYGGRYAPIMLPNNSTEVNEVYNVITTHIKERRQLVQSCPLPPQ